MISCLPLCSERRLKPAPQDLFSWGLEEDEAAADAEGDGFGAGGGAEFAKDRGYVELGGVFGDGEAGGDFFVAKATGEHLEDFALAAGERFGEVVERGGDRRGSREECGDVGGMDEDEAGDGGIEGRF